MKTRKHTIFEHVSSFLIEQNPSVDGLKLFGPRSHHWQEDKLESHLEKTQKQANEIPAVKNLEVSTARSTSLEPEEPTTPDVNIPPTLYKKELQNYLHTRQNWMKEKEKTEKFQNISRPLYQ